MRNTYLRYKAECHISHIHWGNNGSTQWFPYAEIVVGGIPNYRYFFISICIVFTACERSSFIIKGRWNIVSVMNVALTFNCVFLVGMMYVISCIGLVMSCYVITLIGTINVCGCKSMINQLISRKSVILYVVPLAACKLNTGDETGWIRVKVKRREIARTFRAEALYYRGTL